jgi:SAM-dependent methyltransferase
VSEKPDDLRFQFGRNWKDYVDRNFSQERVDISKKHLLGFLARQDLAGLSFIDIGCGSGLHSMAALQAGAASVHSFDYDADSVATTRYLRGRAGEPANWTVEQGSVLDDEAMARRPQYDVVYSWGVLHHTGEVWRAVRNAAGRVKPGGCFYVALYSADVQVDPPPQFWLDVKQRYVAAGWLQRRWLELWYVLRFNLGWNPLRIPGFVRHAWQYKKNRGMNVLVDIRDWLGGWPMEFVYDAEVVKFCEGLGLRLERMATGEANTEFLFVRGPGSAPRSGA